MTNKKTIAEIRENLAQAGLDSEPLAQAVVDCAERVAAEVQANSNGKTPIVLMTLLSVSILANIGLVAAMVINSRETDALAAQVQRLDESSRRTDTALERFVAATQTTVATMDAATKGASERLASAADQNASNIQSLRSTVGTMGVLIDSLKAEVDRARTPTTTPAQP